MNGEGFRADVRQFILDFIDSVEKMEVLLLLERESARAWSAEEVAVELRTTAASAAARLEDLSAAGILESIGDSPRRHQLASADPALRELFGAVAHTYRERRVAVITLIYSRPPDAVRELARAFRLRKDDG
ncbi:MAG: hypothetical protein ACREQQ_11580 [Candidatus Binatia bacterium]